MGSKHLSSERRMEDRQITTSWLIPSQWAAWEMVAAANKSRKEVLAPQMNGPPCNQNAQV